MKVGTPVATLPGAWHYRVSAGTGWSSVSVQLPGEIESWICESYLSVVAYKIVWSDPSLRYTSMLLGQKHALHVTHTLNHAHTQLKHDTPLDQLKENWLKNINNPRSNKPLSVELDENLLWRNSIQPIKRNWYLCFLLLLLCSQLYLWGSPFWVRFLHIWLFFKPANEAVTFCLHGWCMLGVFLLLAFTRQGHECQDLLSLCNGIHMSLD